MLYNCDWKDIINKIDKVDLVVTDPPYELRKYTANSGGTINDRGFDKSILPLNDITDTNFDLEFFCNEIIKVMKDINIYIWCNKKQIVKYFNFFVNEHHCLYDILIWNKPDAMPSYSNKYLTDCEYCLYFHNNGHCFPKTYEDAKTVFHNQINRENRIYHHPTIKPLDFIRSMIRNSSDEGDVVFDPFMGSGTTGVACKELKRDFIGCEINPEYFKICEERINGTKVKSQINTLF